MSDGPQSITDWVKYLHNAAQVKPGSPDYAESREAVSQALRHIHALNVGATMTEATQDEQPSLAQSAATVLGQGPGLGTGEVFRGLGTAIAGQGFRKGASEYRDAVDQAESAHPNTQALLQLLTASALPAARLGQVATQGIRAGVPLSIGQGAARIGAGALTGAVPGAVAGFSGGGSDPGDLSARLSSGGRGAILGALLGAGGTALTIPRVRAHVEHVADIENAGVMRKLQAQRLRNAEAAGLRTKTPAPTETLEVPATPEALSPDAEHAIRDYHAGKISGEDLRVALDIAAGRTPTELPVVGEVSAGFEDAQPISDGPPGSKLRAGEAAEPIEGTGGRGIAVTGPRTTPTVPVNQPTLSELSGTAQLAETAAKIPGPRVIGDDPVAQAIAKRTVDRQIAAGTRGPRGGALVGNTDIVADNRLAALAEKLQRLPTATLQAELDNPMVEDFVKQAAQKELTRRGAP